MKERKFLNLRKGFSVILMWLIFLSMFAQNITVKGTVSDEQGSPLPGVTITVVGSPRGVITDIDGIYSRCEANR